LQPQGGFAPMQPQGSDFGQQQYQQLLQQAQGIGGFGQQGQQGQGKFDQQSQQQLPPARMQPQASRGLPAVMGAPNTQQVRNEDPRMQAMRGLQRRSKFSGGYR
jgi:hypothetical protein